MEMRQVMVRYKVKPERAAENEELQRVEPAGLRYATFQLDDGVSFVHLASVETEDGRSPLSELKAFQEFQEHVRERCEEVPVATELRQIGSFRVFGEPK